MGYDLIRLGCMGNPANLTAIDKKNDYNLRIASFTLILHVNVLIDCMAPINAMIRNDGISIV